MIYFLRDEATQLVKIGFTSNTREARLRDMQTGCPGELVLVFEQEGSKADEGSWHARFAHARVRGEWFSPVPELLLAIMEAKVAYLEADNARLSKSLKASSNR